MQARLDLRTDQRMAMTPAMLRSIEVLQLGADELCAVIDREVAVNETLLARRPRRRDRGGEPWDAAQQVAAPPPDLRTWLSLQLAWRECPLPLAAKVLSLAELLDERGLLPQSDEELAAALGADAWHEALAMLQTLEPRGLGARTAVEAMLLQLDAGDPDRDDIAVLLTEHLHDLACRRTSQVAKALDLTAPDVEWLLGRLKALNPRPATALAWSPAPAPSIELEAQLENGQVVVRARGGRLPELRVSRRYAAMARNGDASTRRYLRPKLAAARGLIRAVGLRQRTLLAVAAAVLQRQVPFLEHGMRQMRPLRMSEVADAVGYHTSTISRAIAGKWVATVHGALPLRGFFDGAHLAATATAAAATAALGQRGVQERLRELIAGEDPARPLSDDELAIFLRSEGIDLARRTVAKYRAALGLGSQWQRRSPSPGVDHDHE